MKKLFGIFVAAIAVLALSATPVLGKHGHANLPFEETGSIGSALYRIVVPEDWNGKLIVDHHSYQGGGDPVLEPVPAESLLLAAGYAIAASSYSVTGPETWKEAPKDTDPLVKLFKHRVGDPDRVMLMGRLIGAIFVTKLIEQHPQTYDGGLVADFPGSGITGIFDRFLAPQLAYDVAFGAASGFQSSDWGTPGDLRDDLTFGADIAPIFIPQFFNPANFGKLEFMRLVYGGLDDWYVPADSGRPPAGIVSMAFLEFFASWEGLAGGTIQQNADIVYTLQDDPAITDEVAYLLGLGIDANALLAQMNATERTADPSARNYMVKYGDFSGNLRKPLLSLNIVRDSIVVPEHVTVYSEAVDARGMSDNYVSVFVDQLGVVSQTDTQYFKAVLALDAWIETGVAPDPDDDDIFPAADGFAPGVVPGPWPF